MKKTIFYFTVLLLSVGFAGGISSAHAASLPSEQEALDSQSMAVLKQSLGILSDLLAQIANRVQQPDLSATEKVQLSALLGSLETSLVQINIAIGAQNTNYAATTPAPIAEPAPEMSMSSEPAVAAMPAPQTQPEEIANPQVVVLSPGGSVNVPLAAVENPAEAPNPNTASVSLTYNWKNLLWPSIALLVVLALILFLYMRERRKVSEVAPAPAIPEYAPLAESTPIASGEVIQMEEAPLAY